jgi:mannitol/fructose-specific phosphotransferase system IIA component (Ntr-type)
MRLSELLPPAQVRVGLAARSKREAIEELVGLLPLAEGADRLSVVAAVLEREAVLSTGIGRGVAVPHGKTPAVDRLMASMAILPEGLAFDAVDGQPCRILFLLVSHPDTPGPHIRALAQVARVLNQEGAKRALSAARSAEEAVAVFREDERREQL